MSLTESVITQSYNDGICYNLMLCSVIRYMLYKYVIRQSYSDGIYYKL